MFQPSQADVRRFFCTIHAKQRGGLPPDGQAYIDCVRRRATR